MFATAGRLLAALVLAGFVVVLGQLPAHACECAGGTTQSYAKQADDVFTGTISKVTSERKPNGQRGAVVTYGVDVDRVYKGTVSTATVQVFSGRSTATCGLGALPEGESYVFFAQSVDAELNANGCGGTGRATEKLVSEVEGVLGIGHAPVPPEPQTANFVRVADAEPTALTRTAAPGLALVLVGLLGLVVVRRLR